MTLQRIPLPFVDVPAFEVQTVLGGASFYLQLRWVDRMSRWALSIKDIDSVPIVSGVTLVADLPLLYRVTDERKPTGELYAIDMSGRGIDPGYFDLDKRVRLLYDEDA